MTSKLMRPRSAALWWAASIASLVAILPASAADLAAGKALATNGTAAGVPACSGCHGAHGEGQAAAGIPRLAGLDAAYLQAQLFAFGHGTRDNAIMSPMAKTMDATTVAAAAAYYASLPAPPAPSPVKTTPQIAAGEVIASRGDWRVGVPPCASCHGARGLGVGSTFPPIVGQGTTYIVNQLKAWKAGTRHDDPLGLMTSVATRLSDSQVASVAAYYATLPALAPPEHADRGSTP